MQQASPYVYSIAQELKSSVWEDPSSWCLLGFIPDLEKTSSAQKQQEAQ